MRTILSVDFSQVNYFHSLAFSLSLLLSLTLALSLSLSLFVFLAVKVHYNFQVLFKKTNILIRKATGKILGRHTLVFFKSFVGLCREAREDRRLIATPGN